MVLIAIRIYKMGIFFLCGIQTNPWSFPLQTEWQKPYMESSCIIASLITGNRKQGASCQMSRDGKINGRTGAKVLEENVLGTTGLFGPTV